MKSLRDLAGLGGLVYSTDHGRMCPDCRQPQAQCVCKAASVPAGDGIVRVSRETKGRGGKAVTVVKGVALDAGAYRDAPAGLRIWCGATVETSDVAALMPWIEYAFEAEIAALEALDRSGAFAELVATGVPAPDLAAMASAAARGRCAAAQKRYDEAIGFYRQAIAIESRLPYQEPPYWYAPIGQSLGAALFLAGRPAEASEAFRAALARIDPDALSPRDALDAIYQLKSLAAKA
mgnify:CR=1 FL=1